MILQRWLVGKEIREPAQLLRGAEAAQRLQGCDCLCSCGVVADREMILWNRIEIGVANPLPAACSLFPDTQARSRFPRQLLSIDHFLHRDHVRDHNVVPARG